MIYLHTILFTLYPILFYFSNNLNEVFVKSIFFPLFISLIFSLLIYLLIYLTIKRKENIPVLTSLFLILFSSYGHIVNIFIDTFKKINNIEIPYNVIFLIIWPLIFIVFILISRKKSFEKVNIPFNLISIVLIIFTLFNIVKNPKLIKWSDKIKTSQIKKVERVNKNYPDIYFIVPDRYARNDVLKKYYNFDNTKFTDYLQEKGFFYADKTISNYPTTTMSLGSELNMKYLNYLVNEYGLKQSDFKPVAQLLRNNEVGHLLKEKGYTFINLGSWWWLTQKFNDVDFNFNSKALVNDEFTIRFLETTMFSEISNYILPEKYRLDFRNEQKNIALYQTKKIKDIVQMDGPKFVLLHLLVPHNPYVFDKNCDYVNEKITKSQKEMKNYLDQLQCANKKLKEITDYILENSKKEPIIILQSDEGPHPIISPLPKDNYWKAASNIALEEKFKILNLLYLPGVDYSTLSNDMSPINTFRFVFNTYLGENFEYLEPKTYIFEDQGHIFDFREISGQLRD